MRVRLVRNAERARGARMRAANQEPQLGAEVTTPAALLQEMWDVFGDGRCLMSSTARMLLMMRALAEASPEDAGSLSATSGTAKLLGAFAERYAGVPAFDALAEGHAFEGFPAGQAAALRVVRRYLELCHEAGRIEPGSAARQLAEGMPPAVVQAEADEPLFTAPALGASLASWGVESPEKARVPSVPDGVEARFSLLAGSTIIVRAVKEEVEAAAAQAASSEDVPNVVVLAADPFSLFNALAPVFADQGISSTCTGRVPFSQTWTGRAIRSAAELGCESATWRAAVTDLAYSPLSGMKGTEAERLNARMRADSLMQEAEAVVLLTEASPACAAFVRLVADLSCAAAEGVAAAVMAASVAAADRLQEACAVEALMRTMQEADELGCVGHVLDILDGISVPIGEETVLEEGVRACARFASLDAMDGLPERSADAVIFADMTKGAFPIPAAKPATDAVAERLGILCPRDRHGELRAAFAAAVASARRSVTCIVPLRDAAGGQNYPSFLYGEFVDAVAQGQAFSADADGLFSVPACARKGFCIKDEADVVRGFGQAFEEPDGALSLTVPVRGRLQALTMDGFMKMSAAKPDLPLLSASQLELYAQCPYQWFIARKVGVHELDEALDSLHAGTFAHEVFRRTFDGLAERGVNRITLQNLEEAQAVAAEAFDGLVREQRAEKPGNRCVAATLPDEMQLRGMKDQIASALAFMEGLPPAFAVSASEFQMEPEDGVEYAGAVINGSVDRVDASDDGRFVVLDYKGSIAGHEAGCSEEALEELPRKVQALIYAQSLPRTDAFAGMACAGALYLGYRAKEQAKFAAGSFDAGAYDARNVADAKASGVTMDFQAFLTQVEDLMAVQVRRMLAGDIAPAPRPGACAYCPFTFCEARMAK